MIKKIMILVSLLFLSLNIYSLSSFVDLCNRSLNNNLELKEYRENVTKATRNKKLNYTNFLPSIGIYSKVYYEQDGIEFLKPGYTGLTLELSQFLPWGLNVNLEPEFLYIKENSKENDYIKQHILTMELTQSLLPAAFYFGRKNPYFSIPEKEMKITDYRYFSKEYSILDSLLNAVMNLRSNVRSIEIAGLNLEMCEKKYNAAYLLEQKGNINKAVYFQQKQYLLDAKNNLNNLLVSQKSILQTLQTLGGFTFSMEELVLMIDDLFYSEDIFTDFLENFDFWNYEYYIDLEKKQKNLSLENMKSNYLISREQYAPKMYAAVECDYTSDTNHNFEISLGFDLSSVLNKDKLQLKKNFKNSEALFKEEMNQDNEFYKSTIKSYESRFIKLMDENQALETEVMEMEKIFLDYNKLYKNNKCSELDFLEVKNIYYQLVYKFDNNKDLINYYELLLNMELSR